MISLRDSLKAYVIQPLSQFTFLHVIISCVCCISPQTNHLCHLCSDADWDAGVHLYPQPGSPLGGFYHKWNFRVGSHPGGELDQKITFLDSDSLFSVHRGDVFLNKITMHLSTTTVG